MALRPECFVHSTPQPGPLASRFCVWTAADAAPTAGLVVYVHPFAEEMNKSRRMAALQARALAAQDCAVLQMDLLGCGDSAGDFGDATWDAWVADVVFAAQLARQRFAQQWPGARQPPLWLWGLRAGCLLAVEAAARMAEPVELLFWQPAASGKLVLQQLLRLATGAALVGKAGAATPESRGQALSEGRPVDVAGYRLHPELASGLEAARLRAVAGGQRLVWLDVSHLADASPTPATLQALAGWQGSARAIVHSMVQGPMFWQTTEIETAPALLDATLRLLSAGTPQPSGQALAGGTA